MKQEEGGRRREENRGGMNEAGGGRTRREENRGGMNKAGGGRTRKYKLHITHNSDSETTNMKCTRRDLTAGGQSTYSILPRCSGRCMK